jgi:glycerol-3-phosphate dehydrogenase
MPFGVQERNARLQSLENKNFDFLIVGGGITGVACARDAALRGFTAACVDKCDFAYGTSSRSSKLIHGGLRYLEQANFRLVFEGTHERARLRKVAPHLVRPIPFMFPVYKEGKHGVFALSFGLWLYDTLAGKRRYGRHRKYSREEVLSLEPSLRGEGLRGGAVYYDCMTDDARLCLENAISAHEAGATMLNYTRFVRALKNDDGRAVGAVVLDELSKREYTVHCKVLIICAGPWTDRVRKTAQNNGEPMIRTTKGIHLLFTSERLPVSHAVVMSSVTDGRVVFAIPRGRVTLVGTTDTDFEGSPDDVHATAEDVDYLMATLEHFFPEANLTTKDIRASYAGLRPLVRDDSDSPYDVSREHTVLVGDDDTVTIAGGKFTTYRLMADDVLNEAMKVMDLSRSERVKCATRDAMLVGAEDLAGEPRVELLAHLKTKMSAEVAEYLVGLYGGRAKLLADGDMTPLVDGFPFVYAQVDHAIHAEAAVTPADVLMRRIPVFYETPDQGLECLEGVVDRMASVFGWSVEMRDALTDDYRVRVQDSRRWRSS